jgi:hypothetical protein
MNMLRFEVTQAPNFAEFSRVMKERSKAFYEQAMTLIVRDIIDGINAHRAIGGGSLPSLEESTIRKKGHNMQLIDRGLLGDTDTYDTQNNYRKDEGVITIKPRSAPREILRKTVKGKWTTRGRSAPRGSSDAEKQFRKDNYDTPRDEVALYLQVEGVGPKRNKFQFFGISQDASQEMIDMMGAMIVESLQAVSK